MEKQRRLRMRGTCHFRRTLLTHALILTLLNKQAVGNRYPTEDFKALSFSLYCEDELHGTTLTFMPASVCQHAPNDTVNMLMLSRHYVHHLSLTCGDQHRSQITRGC